MRKILALAGLVGGIACACATKPLLDESRLVDLTHAFDEATIYLPNEQPFHYERLRWGRDDFGRWRAAGQFSTSEHGGTSLEAPLSFAEGLRASQEIPLTQFVGPIRVVDVASACAKNRDYLVTPDDLARHEQDNGRIPIGAAVIVRTGWERHWQNPRRYLGRSDGNKPEEVHFPGLSAEVARELVKRKVDLVGIDGPGLDNGPSIEFLAHRVLAEANIPGLENLTGIAQLPAKGATLIALPMKIAGGSGGPARVVALMP